MERWIQIKRPRTHRESRESVGEGEVKKYLFLIMVAISVSGCNTGSEQPKNYKTSTYLLEGKHIECFEPYTKRLTCNWEKYNSEEADK